MRIMTLIAFKALDITLLAICIALLFLFAAHFAPPLFASIGWHDLASIGWNG